MPEELLLTEAEAFLLMDLLFVAQRETTDEAKAKMIFDLMNKLDEQVVAFGYAEPEPTPEPIA